MEHASEHEPEERSSEKHRLDAPPGALVEKRRLRGVGHGHILGDQMAPVPEPLATIFA